MNPDPRLGAVLEQGQEAHRPLCQCHRIRRDDHHLVPDRLHDGCLGGQGRLDGLQEPLYEIEGLFVPLLLGIASEPGQVHEAERHLYPAQLPLAAELRLHVPDHVLLYIEAKVPLVDVLHER